MGTEETVEDQSEDVSIRINYGAIGTELQIIRKRFFIDYTSKTEKHFAEEYTLRCISNNKRGVDNLFLKIPKMLPSLRIFDSDGEELPLLTNKLLDALIQTQIDSASEEKDVQDKLKQMKSDLSDHKYFILWIKLPPNKKMKNGEARVVTLEYEAKKEDLAAKTHIQELRSEKYEVFYVIKPPKDYEIHNPNLLIYDKENEWWLKRDPKSPNKKGNPVYYDDEHNLVSVRIKPEIQDDIVLTYAFSPYRSIVKLPNAILWFLIGSSL